jgi:hypothetical protein
MAMPKRGVMRGATSMAPIITAALLATSPRQAMRVEAATRA